MCQAMEEWTRSKMWPFSSFAFMKDMPSFPGIVLKVYLKPVSTSQILIVKVDKHLKFQYMLSKTPIPLL